MKKLFVLLIICILAGCNSKESIEVNYVYENHNEIVKKVLEKIDKEESERILFEENDSFDVFFEKSKEDKNQVIFTVFNATDYYFSGEIDFEVCEFKMSFNGLAPFSNASQTISCPEFVEESSYTYTGELYQRKEEYAFSTPYEFYIYEDDETLFDYTLDLEKITNEDLKDLAEFIYLENILSNYEGEKWIRVYPQEEYLDAYEKNTDDVWNMLDRKYVAGRIWIDTENDIAEIYSGIENELIERINFAK